MSTPKNLAIIGGGRLTEVGYVPAVASTDARIGVVVDPDPHRRAVVRDAIGHPVVTVATVEELFGGADLDRSVLDGPGLDGPGLQGHGTDIDGVIVASPAPFHLEAALAATGAGTPALVEKPPAPDADGARAIAALDPAPWIGFNRRFDPGARAARVAARGVGASDGPVSVTIDLWYRHKSWSPVAVNDDVLSDLGPHVFDWARWVTGADIVSVAATADHHRAEICATLDSGATATIRLASDRSHRERLAVEDASGATIADHRLGGPVAAVLGRLRPGPHPLVTTLAAQVTAFTRAIDGQSTTMLGTAADGVAVMAAVDAARVSARRGGATVSLETAHP